MLRWFLLLFCVQSSLASSLRVEARDLWELELSLKLNNLQQNVSLARTTIRQPQGYTVTLESPVRVEAGFARWQIVYPLIDEGRFEVKPRTWDGYWEMGQYDFEAALLAGGMPVQRAQAALDPMSFCPRDRYGPIVVKYPRQFIECSPERPAYIDRDLVSFTIRTRADRVSRVRAKIDVVSPGGSQIKAGPWLLDLNPAVRRQSFSTTGWKRGEYWIRIRTLQGGQEVGPYMVRKVWKEILPEEASPSSPRPLPPRHDLIAGPWGFSKTRGVRFLSDPLEKKPSGPVVAMERPWESELMFHNSLRFDSGRGLYLLEYRLGEGDINREEEFKKLPSRVGQLISRDGLIWERPNLGLVGFQGQRDNNLVPSETAWEPLQENLEALRYAGDKGVVRYYDPERDGPVDMRHVFLSPLKRSFLKTCRSLKDSHGKDLFEYKGGSYPVEARGNLYLILTPEPILYLGVGMDLYHSTETIRLHVEDKSTGTLFYYFRPGAPAYPPHGVAYDNMHMTRRALGVLWTRDGINWDRRLVLVPDELDVPATQFYAITLFPRHGESVSGRPALALEKHKFNVAVDGQRIYMGALSYYDARAGRQWPEAVWTADFLHWHRFTPRRKMVEPGAPGSHDYGMVKIYSQYYEFGGEWWFPYTAINQVKQDYLGLGRARNLEFLRSNYPNYAEMPCFKNWDQYFQHCKAMRYTPGLARSPVGRVAHAEPHDEQAELVTHPRRLEGESLIINGATEEKGQILAEILGLEGRPLPGFEAQSCIPFRGDSFHHKLRWENGNVASLRGQELLIRFVLDRARLYAYGSE